MRKRSILALALIVCLLLSSFIPAQATGTDHTHVRTRKVITEPTCTEPGYYIGACSICGTPLDNGDIIPPLGHDYQRSVAQEPTCTSDGMAIYSCSRCGDSYREPIPATGHRWGEWHDGDPATCVQYGNRYHDCTRCGIREWERNYAGGLGDHDWGEWVIVKEPTVTEDGLKERVCKIEASHKEQEVIPALGTPDELFFDIEIMKVDADSGEGLDGAYLQIIDKEGNVLDSWTSSAEFSHTTSGLLSDTEYFIREAKAPEGYDTAAEICFTFDEIGFLTTTGLTTEGGVILVENKKNASNAVEIMKIDADTGEGLDGAYLQIFNKDGNVIDSWTSSAESSHTTSGLLSDTEYFIREAKAPEGYDTAAEICFTFDEIGFLTTTGLTTKGGVILVEDKKIDDGPHSALLLEDTWASDAGVGKRYEGATVPIYCKVTNTGDCPVYSFDYLSFVTDIVFPNGTAEIAGETHYVIQPGESWTYTFNKKVDLSAVEKGVLEFSDSDLAIYHLTKDRLDFVYTNEVPVSIPLTYPDDTTPEEDKPAIRLTVTQITPERESYVAVPWCEPDNKIYYDITVTNTGNVPLRFWLRIERGADNRLSSFGKGSDVILNPGKSWKPSDSWSDPIYWLYLTTVETLLPPENEAHLGIYPLSFSVWGYAVDDPEFTTRICEDGPVQFKHNIRNPGPTTWPFPEQSQMKVDIYTALHSSDPAGYQLGEPWGVNIKWENIGLVDIPTFDFHIDYIADNETNHKNYLYFDDLSWMEDTCSINLEPSDYIFYGGSAGYITEKDVERGYIEVSAYAKWIDPDSGNEKIAYSNVWHLPVISKTGLLLTKKADTPPNGEYFKPGEKVNWTLDVTNNSNEPIRNVTVTDNGMVIATFAEIVPGETKPCAVPPTTVTDYDAQVTGYVMNTAKATGTDLKDAVHTWYSNPAKAVCKDPDNPPILGANPGLSAVKKDNGPKNGLYYQENEEITFTITVTNTGDCELNNLVFYDSLAGFTPVDSLASLPVAGSHDFTYKYTVKPADMNHPTLTNAATINYSFLGNPGTPVSCKDTVKIGDGDTNIEENDDPPFDPGVLKGKGDSCLLTLETLGTNEARYTLHACDTHYTTAAEAEAACLAGDWKKAAELWQAEIDKLYEILYAAANDEAKCALLEEKLQFDTEAENLAVLYGDEALAEILRLKCSELCSIIHTASDTLPSSLTNSTGTAKALCSEAETTARVIGLLKSADCEVTDTFAGPAALALEATMDLLHNAKSYDADVVFLRAQGLWQNALDKAVGTVYANADRDGRKLIALWRISIDSLLSAERPLLELLYPDNHAMAEELLMDIYKDAGFEK